MKSDTQPQTLERQFANPRTPLEREIARLGPWFHNLHLPGGVETAPTHPLGDFPAFKWRQLAPHLPADLTGLRALDIGCNAGFYTFELARRGAHVTGIDLDERYLAQARWAAGQLGLGGSVEFHRLPVYELARRDWSFDLVLFLGVFYHLRYPLLALDIIARITRSRLIFQTMTMPGETGEDQPADLPLEARDALASPGWPRMAFIEHRFAGDVTNWWAPNPSAVDALLRSAGFKVESRPGDEIVIARRDDTRSPWLRDYVASELDDAAGLAS